MEKLVNILLRDDVRVRVSEVHTVLRNNGTRDVQVVQRIEVMFDSTVRSIKYGGYGDRKRELDTSEQNGRNILVDAGQLCEFEMLFEGETEPHLLYIVTTPGPSLLWKMDDMIGWQETHFTLD